ncbi:MAG: hypothetical protein GX834_04125, partial [Clostridiaceae bacterium]|nr:hypothetical protein [Clostridiaceae bacterium]
MNKRFSRLTLPYIIWIAVFTIAPLLLVAIFAITAYDLDGILDFTLNGSRNIFGGATVTLDWLGLKSIFGLNI